MSKIDDNGVNYYATREDAHRARLRFLNGHLMQLVRCDRGWVIKFRGSYYRGVV